MSKIGKFKKYRKWEELDFVFRINNSNNSPIISIIIIFYYYFIIFTYFYFNIFLTSIIIISFIPGVSLCTLEQSIYKSGVGLEDLVLETF